MHHAERGPALIVRVGARTVAFPADQVAETMRPLPIEPIAGLPDGVLGLSVIRGAPVPVVDLAALFDGRTDDRPYGRFVTLRLGARRIAVAVDAVLGVINTDAVPLAPLPPLLRDTRTEVVEAIGTRDAELLLVLRTARIVPHSLWTAPGMQEAVR